MGSSQRAVLPNHNFVPMINFTNGNLLKVPYSTPNLHSMGQVSSKDEGTPRGWNWQHPRSVSPQAHHLGSRRQDSLHSIESHPRLTLNTEERQPRAHSQDRERRRSRSRKRSHSPHHQKYSIPSTFFLSPITSNEDRLADLPGTLLMDRTVPSEGPDHQHYDVSDASAKEPSRSSSGVDFHNYNLHESTYDVGLYTNQPQEEDEDMNSGSELEEPFSPLLSLPLEILYTIIEIVYYDDNSISINSNLENFANTIPLLSKKIHQLSLCFLYKYAIFNRPHAFEKFLSNLLNSPTIGKYVEYMDFQQFTSIGLGRTGRMNQEIQMVTSATIAKALNLTPNLIEFLASENIQDDMDVNVLDLLFNHLPKVQALDFCGASSDSFVKAFQQLVIKGSGNSISEDVEMKLEGTEEEFEVDEFQSPPPMQQQNIQDSTQSDSSLDNLMKLSFHDCSSLTADIFIKLLPHFHSLTRLDLNHTSINSTILLNNLPHTVRLTHLSLARCSKLTTKDLINFLTTHPAVANDSLQWLNLQIDSNVVSPLSDVYLLYTLRHLKAPKLKYLNLGGLPVNPKILNVIKNKFTELESLSISHASVTFDDLLAFLKDNDSKLKFLDLTGIKNFSRWNLNQLLKTVFNGSLIAVEFDYKILFDLTSKGQNIKITPVQQSYIDEASTPQVWKFYDNEGRRSWIYKLEESDPEFTSILNTTNSSSAQGSFTSNLVYYDLETGNKIVSKVKKPDFLKYASRKISCSIGYYNLRNAKKLKPKESGKYVEDVWPSEFSQRGIYNYYSLNIK